MSAGLIGRHVVDYVDESTRFHFVPTRLKVVVRQVLPAKPAMDLALDDTIEVAHLLGTEETSIAQHDPPPLAVARDLAV